MDLLNLFKNSALNHLICTNADFECNPTVPSVTDKDQGAHWGRVTKTICTCFAFESPELRLKNVKQEDASAKILSTSIDRWNAKQNKKYPSGRRISFRGYTLTSKLIDI